MKFCRIFFFIWGLVIPHFPYFLWYLHWVYLINGQVYNSNKVIFSVYCSLPCQVAEHHTVVWSLPSFPVEWGRQLGKKKKEVDIKLFSKIEKMKRKTVMTIYKYIWMYISDAQTIVHHSPTNAQITCQSVEKSKVNSQPLQISFCLMSCGMEYPTGHLNQLP